MLCRMTMRKDVARQMRGPLAWTVQRVPVPWVFMLALLLSHLPAFPTPVGGTPLSGSDSVQADQAASSTAADGDSYEKLLRDAKALFRDKKYQESLKVLERCLAFNKQDPELYKLIASDAILVNRMDIAEKALNTALGLAPADPLTLFNLGALYYTDSRFPKALPVLEESVKLDPNYMPARLFLGLTQEELAQEKSAIATYLKAIELAERSGFQGDQPYLYLGRLLYRQNKLNESLPYLQKAVQANPQSCEGLCLLARVQSFQGRENQAVETLGQCLRAEPEYPEAHYLLSRAYVKQGRPGDAARELALFQELKKTEQNRKDPRKNQRAIP
jgi:tetratricopeptide (TPR) repeat protein